jgi:hypothetical protein
MASGEVSVRSKIRENAHVMGKRDPCISGCHITL